MKKLIPGLLAFALLLLFACNNDDDGGSLPTSDCNISCKVNGDLIQVDPSSGCIFLDSTLNIGLFGTDAIMLQVNNLSQPGTYDLSEIPNTAFVNLPDGTQIGALSGSIVITQLSGNKAKGTFSGSFYDITDLMQTPNYTVTEGSFEASF
ncbi:MAG: hypothetical protein CMN32_06800 [Saprospirales bacterium]|nr:hypothetical protein [Saprospirales bacterium]